MKSVSRSIYLGVFLLCAAAPADQPVVNIDYQKNLKLWRAQRNILTAFEYVEQADRDSPRGLGSHSGKARALLVQAAKELKLASAYGGTP